MRKTNVITITDDNRDKGKTFFLQEMPATQAERWAIRFFLALAKSGADVPDDILQRGIAGVAMVTFKMLGGLPYEDAFDLMDEMFRCVKLIGDPMRPEATTRNLVEDDIEEIQTRLFLRKEVFSLHVDFSKLVARFKSASAAGTPDAGSPSTPTSL